MDISIVQNIVYIISSILFISGIKMLGKEDTAVKGNFLSALAMLVAVLVTFINVTNPLILIVGIGLGAVVGSLIELPNLSEVVLYKLPILHLLIQVEKYILFFFPSPPYLYNLCKNCFCFIFFCNSF